MEWALRLLSLGALNCNWNVLRTQETSILTSTWCFEGVETLGVLGRLSHTSFVRYGEDAVVNFYVQRNTTGKRLKTYSKSSGRLLGILQSTSVNALVSLGQECYLGGIQETGFLSAKELELCTSPTHSQGNTYQRCWTKSSVNGVLVWDTSIVSTSNPPPMESDE